MNFEKGHPEEISRLIHLPIEFTGNYLEFQDLNTRTHSIAGEGLRAAGKLITVYQEYLVASSPTDFELALSKAVAVGFAAEFVGGVMLGLTGMPLIAVGTSFATPIAIDLTASAYQILYAHAERELSELVVYLNREIYQLYHVPMF